MIRKIIYTVLILAAVLLALAGPIDRTPLKEKAFYKEMTSELDTLEVDSFPALDTLLAGWSSFSMVPDYPMPMAGYSPRDSFRQVHDTLFTRIIAINNGNKQVYMISMDLLLVPPVIRDRVLENLKGTDANAFVYFSATHTHNGLGGWNNSIGGEFYAGDYDEQWIDQVSENILVHLDRAKKSMISTKLSYWQSDASEYVSNRLAGDQGEKDGMMRGLKFERTDGKKALLFTYGAHATSISSSSRALSGDYPAEVIQSLHRQGWDFPVFMGGMVGSHTLAQVPGENFELTKNAGIVLSQKIINSTDVQQASGLTIATGYIHVPLGASQLRLLDNWKLRDWVFRLVLGKLDAQITYLKLGNILMLGTPCDFSGELATDYKLDSLATLKYEHLIITSFNGDYIGYITDDRHYDTFQNKEEVRTMNWVGPYYGEYFSDIIKKLIDK